LTGTGTRWGALVAGALLVAACSSGGARSSASSGATTTAPTSTTTTTTTTAPPPTLPAVWTGAGFDGPVRAVVAAGGIVVPVVADNGDGSYVVTTPCGAEATVGGDPLRGADVVLDPGHGGNEPGAVGPTGLVEKDVNLSVAEDVRSLLEAQGASVVLTRTSDQNTTLATRAKIATNLQPKVFVSIHHNAEPDGPSATPGNETYYQIASADSKRLAGLIWEEITGIFIPYGAAWVADTDHGAKYREGSRGDYYGILRLAAGVPTVLSEAAFITNPPEEALLRTAEFRHAEAVAIATAITRFVTTPDPGSGFVTPYPREEPAGGGGGPEGCVDPPL
jgi:N-acetylmuramoyl-L-alanine amidase